MLSNEEKLELIRKEIEQTVEEQASAILKSASQKWISALSDAEAKANEDAARYVEKAKKDIHTRETTAISKATLQYRTELLQRSEGYAKEIFEAARARLVAFHQSPEYAAYLKARLTAVASDHSFASVTVRLSPADKALEGLCGEAFSVPCRVEYDDAIAVGGFVAENLDEGYACDETLDNALEEQRAWFYANSGLVLKAI